MELTSLDVIADALGETPFAIGAMSSPDGAVTILLTDLEDCPAITKRLGDERAAELLRNHRTLVEKVVQRYDGEVVKVERDAVMASFTSSHAGLRCAIDLQKTFDELEVDGVGRLRLRAGLHSGFVISSGEAVYGRNIVLAARIADQARGGEILISVAVKEYTETDPSFRFDSRGEFYFRGVHGEHELFSVAWA